MNVTAKSDASQTDQRMWRPQIKDGGLYQESVLADMLTELKEENVEADEKQLKADIASCATKSKCTVNDKNNISRSETLFYPVQRE